MSVTCASSFQSTSVSASSTPRISFERSGRTTMCGRFATFTLRGRCSQNSSRRRTGPPPKNTSPACCCAAPRMTSSHPRRLGLSLVVRGVPFTMNVRVEPFGCGVP